MVSLIIERDTPATSCPETMGAVINATALSYRSSDPLYVEPFVDVDEWRDAPLRHRYVHGGFTGTDLLFSFYLPPAERYGGRFFHPVLPMAGTESAAGFGMLDGMGGSFAFVFDSGGYLVESNMGSKLPSVGDDPTIAFRASAAAARFSRVLASEMYGVHRPYGYVFGGSGGAFKSISCMESVPDVWDGAVPFVAGSPISIPNVSSVQAHAMRLLWDKFPRIVDAIEPGGSGDMYDGLDAEQREALAEVTRFGFPPGAWFDFNRINATYTMLWTFFADTIRQHDPNYFSDFWTVPGYLGANPPESLVQARIEATTSVTGVVLPDDPEAGGLPASLARQVSAEVAALPVALRLASIPSVNLRGTSLRIQTGAAAGRTLYISDVIGDLVVIGFGSDPAGLGGVEQGDDVELDNSDYLAFQTYHRHQCADGFDAFDQYRAAGRWVFPQRSTFIGPRAARGGAGSLQSGRFSGKMILVESMLDEAAYPWQADWYRRRVQGVLGDRTDDQFRLLFVEHAMHGTPSPLVVPGDVPRPSRLSRTIDYRGVLEQALRDVSAWVEFGVTPPSSTRYEIVDAQVILPSTAGERRGIQPVVDLTIEGAVRTQVGSGQAVTFTARIEVPHGTGTVVRVEWDFLGDGEFAAVHDGIDGSSVELTAHATHVFDEVGTFFPAVRVTSHRQGDTNSPHGRIHNLGRVRVVVS
jgi:hypothetical protein